MRAKVTLDEDVVKLLRAEMRCSGTSLTAAVNHFLRIGLMSSGKRPRKRFVVQPRAMGLRPGLSYEKPQVLLEALDQTHR
ncbi:MAG: hypothetical protein ACLPZF_12395 [Candidatus Acidiferrales bacterium]